MWLSKTLLPSGQPLTEERNHVGAGMDITAKKFLRGRAAQGGWGASSKTCIAKPLNPFPSEVDSSDTI